MVSRWFRLTAVTGLCGVAVVLAGAAVASAKLAHVYSTSFTGSGASALSEPAGIAVDNATGDVYVVDKGHSRVEEFDSSGAAIGEFNGEGSPTGAFSAPEAIAVDNSTSPLDPSAGDVYVTDRGHKAIDKFGATGTYLGQTTTGAEGKPFGTLYGVAVDTEGKLWVYQGNGEIDDYTDALDNEFIATREDPRGAKPAFAVDSTDNLYVKTGVGTLAKVSSEGVELEEEVETSEVATQGVAVDPSNDRVYFDTSSEVSVLDDASRTVLESFGAGHLTAGEGVAVNATSGTVYVADSAGNDVAVFVLGTLADDAVEPVSSFPSGSSATLKGAVNPDGTTVTGCEFEYGTEAGVFTGKAACSPAPPLGGEQSVAVSATATGLTQGVTYYYRLTSTNEVGSGSSSEGKFLMPETLTVEGESASFVEARSAMLEATIDPGGSEVEYHFEYGPAAGAYDVSVPIPDGGAAASSSSVTVRAVAAHLEPSTAYHFRVVAANRLPGAVAGPDQTFTTLAVQGSGSPPGCTNERARTEQPHGLALPDCRAYEMVSPLEKNDNNVSVNDARASITGEAVTYDSLGSFGQAAGAELFSRYVSRRSPAGWMTRNISPPFIPSESDLFTPFEQLLFTPDLSKGVLRTLFGALTGTPQGYDNVYVADTRTGSYEDATPVTPPNIAPYREFFNQPIVGGASSDLTRVVFQQHSWLTPNAAVGKTHVYDWVNGQLHLVDVSPSGEAFAGNGSIGDGAEIEIGPVDAWHAVSSDGLRVFFSAGEEEGQDEGQLYMRVNPEQPQSPVAAGKCTEPTDACTIEVSASQRETADPHGPQPARYWGASTDGSRVFFTSKAELTGNAYTGASDNASNLYEYDVQTGVLTDLTVDPGDANGAEVLGLASAGEDGAYVYFVARGASLASNENSHHDRAVAGKPNLFVYHAGQVSFVATLANGGAEGSDESDWRRGGGPADNTARASADGTHLAFDSHRSLTGYDNEAAEAEACRSEGNHCDEVYEYDAGGGLVCVSCDPSGARPAGPADIGAQGQGAIRSEATYAPSPLMYAQRSISEDGSRVFFETPDALVQSDSNGRRDVYEYELGHVYPISDVTGRSNSYLLDASPSGNDVFIATADGLVGADNDGLIDVYDARVDGGFPVQAAPPECDNADECKGQVSPQPGVFGSPASATFAGAGNAASPLAGSAVKPKAAPRKRCRSGYRRKHGRCVKSKAKRSSRTAARGSGTGSKRRGK